MEKLLPNPLIKSQNWAYHWINSMNFYAVCFIVCPSWWLPKYIESTNQFQFSEKNISQVIFYQMTKFHCLLAFTSWDIERFVYFNHLLSSIWCHKFWKQAKNISITSYPTDHNKRFKFAGLKLFMSYIIVCKTILQKSSS